MIQNKATNKKDIRPEMLKATQATIKKELEKIEYTIFGGLYNDE